ncbi:MAG: DUF5765 domain-containing protein [Alphaproteobacteria bacterium]|nr:DUF5765 domain-containing protein [Alphaproteobacteria bacterium]
MCWSGEASTVLATIGFGTCAYAAYKKKPTALWISLGYFSLMEALQAYTYSVIDQCSLPSNQIATLLGYLHIAFQPFFVNLISMHFIPDDVRKKIQGPVYCLCFAAAIIMILQVYPFDWAGVCTPTRPLCSKTLCSVTGSWHVAWNIPINGIGNSLLNIPIVLAYIFSGAYPYTLVATVLPFIYGSWRVTLYLLLSGPLLAQLLTNNKNERPAVWCLLSAGMLLIIILTPLSNSLHVKKWLFYPKKA